ncbi:hypothetical protein AUEXF2481DRAFT_86870 [Aureobasidium subglaciale EXF-2481]|uniref:Phytochrome chromophore attachment site domain-containing protein n=1 Tax=Aureobasidium subglaciale (strain EXF-2481) TaxID=1043005 RepID=A0A074ZHE2_AURSE|nr:uncharacterized protein AUEXF2481DRAFT_86870 [Aureobasidium subglaciale EXF-2481]KEQ97986.1 hypothetical protein AUEXF2481DRAFT_86870 [Aureobasidium subglaciale EXF-2481]
MYWIEEKTPMSLTQSRVFPVSSLVSIDCVPIILSTSPRHSTKTNKRPAFPTSASASALTRSAQRHLIPSEDEHDKPSHVADVAIHQPDLSGLGISTSTQDEMEQQQDAMVALSGVDSIQAFGAAIGLEQDALGNLLVSMASDNSKSILGYSTTELFALESFHDLLEPYESKAFIDHMAAAHDRANYSSTRNVFEMNIKAPDGSDNRFSCVVHADITRPSLLLCELVPQHGARSPCALPRYRQLSPARQLRPKYYRHLRRDSATNAMAIMDKAHSTVSVASTIDGLLESLVASIKNATGHQDVFVHRFDEDRTGRLIAQSKHEESYQYFANSTGPTSCSMSHDCLRMFRTLEVQVHRGQETSCLLDRPDSMLERPLESKSLYMRTMPHFQVADADTKLARSRVLVPLMISGKIWGVVTGYSFLENEAPLTFLCRNWHQKIIGTATEPQEAFALVEYLQLRRLKRNLMSSNFAADFPNLRYNPGFRSVEKLLLVPISSDGEDFVVYFREAISTSSHQSVETWDESEPQIAAITHTVYVRFSALWKEKEEALQQSRLYKLLLSNSSHEFRTLLNAISNYLEFAGEGQLEAKESEVVTLAKATSQSLLGAVTKLLDCVDRNLQP